MGSLSAILHVLAATIGIGLVAGIAALAIWHVVFGWTLGRRSPVAVDFAWQELVAVTVVLSVVLTWSSIAIQSSLVEGTDAASYHVPNAVNFARGASLFDPPATQHLYPVAGSVVAAWFFLPVKAPLAVDLGMILPALLLGASINLIFRIATGFSGLAWATWLTVALFSMRLFRESSVVSADLWFTAAHVALLAALLQPWTAWQWRRVDWLPAGIACGLLLGSKTTGIATAGLLLLTFVVLALTRWAVSRTAPAIDRPRLGSIALAAAVCIAAGGIWLVRNWILFGSPLAPNGVKLFGVTVFDGEPVQASTHLSALADIQRDASYDLASRAAHFARLWFAPWFLTALTPAVFVAVELLIPAAWQRARGLAWARLGLVALSVLPGAALVWLLIGAPWTSLEWTRGSSLRYALPVAVSAALLAATGLFPVVWQWARDRSLAAFGFVLAISLSLWVFIASTAVPGPPRIDLVWAVVAVGLVLVLAWRPRIARQRTLLLTLLLIAGSALWLNSFEQHATRDRLRAEEVLAEQLAANRTTIDQHRLPLLDAMRAETASGRPCSRRRFVVLTRFDLPLELQPPDFSSLVFYTGRDLALTSRLAGLSHCDYIITTEALLRTQRGIAMASMLMGGRPAQHLGGGPAFTLLGR
ncbi:MAG TPA: hypothetical protein VFV98_19445 [Vicinamibacterales bacterium]|nr:hypothetical protein [Vicinamibacterales bacterium]